MVDVLEVPSVALVTAQWNNDPVSYLGFHDWKVMLCEKDVKADAPCVKLRLQRMQQDSTGNTANHMIDVRLPYVA